MVIPRKELVEWMRAALRRAPVVALLGPRQCGKTTLVRHLLPGGADCYFDLEDPADARLLEAPMMALQGLRGLVVIDEVQRAPEVFPVLRVLADRIPRPAKFLILGSASPDLVRQAGESLAGRVEMIEMSGLGMGDVEGNRWERLWVRGGFPRSFLARSEKASVIWREQFVRTFLERDLGVLGFGGSPKLMGRFWTMVSHYHGQLWNASEVGASLGVAANTARNYLDMLESSYMVRRLLPWHENVGKRLVRTPKIYFRDSGLFHSLQGIESMAELRRHPKMGASWEGFALDEVLRVFRPREAYFYSVHSGAELDLFFQRGGERWGIEFKWQDAPGLTRSMRVALEDLRLDRLWVVYPGDRRYRLAEKVEVVPLAQVGEGSAKM